MSRNDGAPPSVWKTSWQSVLHFDAKSVNPWMGLRNSLGLTLPLCACVALGYVPAGVSMSLGALNVAFRDSDTPYAQRAKQLLLASVLGGIAVFSGSLSASSPVLAVILAGSWAFVAGLMIALSASAAEQAAMSLVLLLIYQAIPLNGVNANVDRAAIAGLLAFGGGLAQTFLSLIARPLRRYAPERISLGNLYLELARAAESAPQQPSDAPAATAESLAAQAALATLVGDRSTESDRIRFLLSQAERMRLCLLALRRLRARLIRESSAASEQIINSEEITLDQFLSLSARVLRFIGTTLREADPSPLSSDDLPQLDTLVNALHISHNAPSSAIEALTIDIHFQMTALAGQLRAAHDLALTSTPAGTLAFQQYEARKPWQLRLNGGLATLRANLNVQSAACRHAIRLAVCVVLGDTLARGLHLQRSYWLPMTIAIVLRSDFAATFSRGLLRLVGTFAGLIFATVLVHFLPGAVFAHLLAIAALMFIIRCFGPANYGVAVMGITAMVVFLISLGGIPPGEVMLPRLLNTAIGGSIALLAYWVWPTWERHQIPEAMARMLDAVRLYFRAVRESLMSAAPTNNIAPNGIAANRIEAQRVAARLARSNLEASIDRSSTEPGLSAQRTQLLSAMLASTRRMARALMALEAAIAHNRPTSLREEFGLYANHVELTLYYLASALRGSSSISLESLPDLRSDYQTLIQHRDLQPSDLSALPLKEAPLNKGDHALFIIETDRLTNSLNTLSEEVSQWIGSPNISDLTKPDLNKPMVK